MSVIPNESEAAIHPTIVGEPRLFRPVPKPLRWHHGIPRGRLGVTFLLGLTWC